MRRDDFLTLNESARRPKASRVSPTRATPPPARCASSTPSITASRPLKLFAYAWGEASALPADTHARHAGGVPALGLPGQPADRARAIGSTAMLALYREIGDERAELPYDIDGVVYKVDRLDWQQPPGLRQPRAALGDRPQVPGRAGPDRAEGDHASRSGAPAR